jgi:MscS family membrane protein
MRSVSVTPHRNRSPRICSRHVATILACAVALAFSVSSGAAAQEATPVTNNELRSDVPRAAMLGYLEAARAGDYKRAAGYLDLHRLSSSARASQGPALARELKTVLDRELWVDLETLSDQPEGDTNDNLPPGRDLVGTINTSNGAVPILLDRVHEDGQLVWKIAASTVARIPSLYDQFGYGTLGEYLPDAFFQLHFLEVQLWQWIGLLLLVVVASVASWVVTTMIIRIVRPIVARTRMALDDRIVDSSAAPLRLLIGVLLFVAGTYPLGFAVPVQAFLVTIQKALVIVATTWLLVRFVNLSATAIEEWMVRRGQAMALSVVPLGRRTVQVLVTAAALLAILQNFGVNVTGILAGLGIGGLAVALAAQKTVENLFGGVTLIMDQPVRVGDFCRFGDKIGTVEEVGLRSTRVRTLDRTLVTIPNAEFSSLQLENFTKRDRIWFHPTIGLRYETTSDQLRYVLVELKKLLLMHPRVHPDPARPRFVSFSAYSLDIEIFAYILTSDYNEFLAIQEDLLLRIIDIIAASGTGFAFPSQTIYTGRDSGLDAEKSRAAEVQVQAWRETNALGLPYFPPEEAVKISRTLDYPPKGSAVQRST